MIAQDSALKSDPQLRPATTTALLEISNVSQPAGEPRRRWFVSDDLDLFVWYDESGRMNGFQLCYDKDRSEHALTWQPNCGFSHKAVDDGKRVGGKPKAIPILVAGGLFPAKRVADCFAGESAELPPELADFVNTKLQQHPDYVAEA
jgi:hypothetical protein